ncbi:MAG: pyruvate, phosphate dikinase [Candidatus Eremiobacteraeota bacterium]|nr:pyruvate, phosphate dikinase [Candidatus Eremiobacteraeota bacterium]
MTKKRIYLFNEGKKELKNLLGGKGANLAEMTSMGFPVPPGFTITTEVCNEFNENDGKMPDRLTEEIHEAMKYIEKEKGQVFGDSKNPLLVSVRSGARVSMPGMMDTVLNLGLNAETIKGLINKTNNPRFAYDAYRRFVMMYSDVVMGVSKHKFEQEFKGLKKKLGIKEDYDIPAEELKKLVVHFKEIFKKNTGREFPEDVYEQLFLAVKAVFESWNNERAIVYREREGIPHTYGTAVNIQAMAYGNMGENSGTGVAFTRDSQSGEKVVAGEFLLNAQGEDVVAGVRTPLDIAEMEKSHPAVYKEFLNICGKLEKHYKDMQDMEFTIEDGRLYMLQTRNGKRTALAAIKIAVDMVHEGLITKEMAVDRIKPEQIDLLLHPYFDNQAKAEAKAEGRFLAKGINASPGAATGIIIFDAVAAIKAKEEGKPVILTRPETTPDDAGGMNASVGILTSTGGSTSHAALVARGWGIPCIVGCEALTIDLVNKKLLVDGKTFKQGDWLSLDGATGEVFEGKIRAVKPEELMPQAKELLSWADDIRKLGVYANADNPRDAKRARSFGAEGIGLCRTEHMFMEEGRLPVVQKMIMVAGDAERTKRLLTRLEKDLIAADEDKKSGIQMDIDRIKKEAKEPWKVYQDCLDKLAPMQKEDFYGILKAMEGRWVIIRLLDPPLHEFLPDHDETFEEVIKLRISGDNPKKLKEKEELLEKIKKLREFNPMLGLRVCRLGIVYPSLYEMQANAIFEAACQLKKEGVDVKTEVMIPGVSHINEMIMLRKMVDEIAHKVMKREGVEVEYKVGTMIELPRACTIAGTLADPKHGAQFFSFGTNDLTQTTFGYSRDDAAGTFIPVYIELGILEVDPFQVVDREGVGRLMKMAVNDGRAMYPDLEVGICGEHGGEPKSVEFCYLIGLDYVSCSPFRVPIARLAAAHAVLRNR